MSFRIREHRDIAVGRRRLVERLRLLRQEPARSAAVGVGERCRDCRRIVLVRFDTPVTPGIPVVAEHFAGMHGAARAVATLQIFGRTILVTAPADALGMLGVEGEAFGQGRVGLNEVGLAV